MFGRGKGGKVKGKSKSRSARDRNFAPVHRMPRLLHTSKCTELIAGATVWITTWKYSFVKVFEDILSQACFKSLMFFWGKTNWRKKSYYIVRFFLNLIKNVWKPKMFRLPRTGRRPRKVYRGEPPEFFFNFFFLQNCSKMFRLPRTVRRPSDCQGRCHPEEGSLRWTSSFFFFSKIIFFQFFFFSNSFFNFFFLQNFSKTFRLPRKGRRPSGCQGRCPPEGGSSRCTPWQTTSFTGNWTAACTGRGGLWRNCWPGPTRLVLFIFFAVIFQNIRIKRKYIYMN